MKNDFRHYCLISLFSLNEIDAVKLVKSGSEIIGGKGGGGRSDFAQAGGTMVDKIEESFENIKKLIN